MLICKNDLQPSDCSVTFVKKWLNMEHIWLTQPRFTHLSLIKPLILPGLESSVIQVNLLTFCTDSSTLFALL